MENHVVHGEGSEGRCAGTLQWTSRRCGRLCLNTVAVGVVTGQQHNGGNTVAVGVVTGQQHDGGNTVAIGVVKGQQHDGGNTVAVGVVKRQQHDGGKASALDSCTCSGP
eukprot:343944-Pelagomonas_calceolata.AAC.8